MKVAIVGAGPGGLTAGMLLAHKGFDVKLFEKDDVVGGRNKELENCYLVGGGTHPGSGLPTIYESGRITAELIGKRFR
jgi:phytoene dehydrogenase-like protein